MWLVPYARFNIKTSLSKKAIIDILHNSIGVESSESKRKFISGEITEREFKIKTPGRLIPHEAGSGLFLVEGKIFEESNGCRVEFIISYGKISLLLAISGLLVVILLSFFNYIVLIGVGIIYLLLVIEFNIEIREITADIDYLLKGTDFRKQ
jgi:hypothetical protein